MPELSRADALREIDSCERRRVVDGILALAFHDPDRELVEAICLRHARHPDASVRGIAVLCFGHLARIHRRLGLESVVPVLEAALRDRSSLVRGQAEAACDDLRRFMGADLRLPLGAPPSRRRR